MSRGYRSDHVALGLVLGISLTFNALGWLSVGWDWISLEKARPDTSSYAEQQCARQQAEHAARQSALLEGDQAPTAREDSNQTDGAKNREPNWCDLAAQQSMADSTVGMVQSAWVAVVLTFAGVVLICGTLYYTRITARDVRETLNTERRAIELEYRPIIVQNAFNIVAFPHCPPGAIRHLFQFNFINKGRTPARIVEVKIYKRFMTRKKLDEDDIRALFHEINNSVQPSSEIITGESSYITPDTGLIDSNFNIRRTNAPCGMGLTVDNDIANSIRMWEMNFPIVACQLFYRHAITDDERVFMTQVAYWVVPVLDAGGQLLRFYVEEIDSLRRME